MIARTLDLDMARTAAFANATASIGESLRSAWRGFTASRQWARSAGVHESEGTRAQLRDLAVQLERDQRIGDQ